MRPGVASAGMWGCSRRPDWSPCRGIFSSTLPPGRSTRQHWQRRQKVTIRTWVEPHQRRPREIPRALLCTSSPSRHAASPSPTPPPPARPLRTYTPSPLGLFWKPLPCFLVCVRCSHPHHALCFLCMHSLLWEETERAANDGWLKREYQACDSCDHVLL